MQYLSLGRLALIFERSERMKQGFAERQTYDVLFGEDKPMQQKQAREEMYEKEK